MEDVIPWGLLEDNKIISVTLELGSVLFEF